MGGWLDRWVDGWMMDEWVDGWIDGWMDGWIWWMDCQGSVEREREEGVIDTGPM